MTTNVTTSPISPTAKTGKWTSRGVRNDEIITRNTVSYLPIIWFMISVAGDGSSPRASGATVGGRLARDCRLSSVPNRWSSSAVSAANDIIISLWSRGGGGNADDSAVAAYDYDVNTILSLILLLINCIIPKERCGTYRTREE